MAVRGQKVNDEDMSKMDTDITDEEMASRYVTHFSCEKAQLIITHKALNR